MCMRIHQVIKQHEKYLGLPYLIGRNKKKSFREIKEKLEGKLVGWKEKLLSKAWKEALIKAIAQAIPTYARSCFKILDSLCDEMTSLIRNFWWGQCKEERKTAWISWEKFCVPKANGGIGFKQLKQLKYIWQVNVPHKVYHFTWRSCKNILPTKDNLMRRKIVSDSCCEECHEDVESLGHLFWECPRAREIWALSNLFPTTKDLQFHLFMDLLWYLVMVVKWDQETIEKIIMIS